MTESIWAAGIFRAQSWPHFSAVRGLEPDEPLEPTEFRKRYVYAQGLIKRANIPRGIKLDLHSQEDSAPARRFPQLQWSKGSRDPQDAQIAAIPEFAHLGRFVVISGACAEIIRDFSIGKVGLFEVDLFQGNETTRIAGNWFVIWFGEVKNAFSGMSSRNVFPIDAVQYMCAPIISDYDLAVGREARGGSAIWLDPALPDFVFFSDRIWHRLNEAGCAGVLRDAARVRIT